MLDILLINFTNYYSMPYRGYLELRLAFSAPSRQPLLLIWLKNRY